MRRMIIALLHMLCVLAAPSPAPAGVVSSTLAGWVNPVSDSGSASWSALLGFTAPGGTERLPFEFSYAYDPGRAIEHQISTGGPFGAMETYRWATATPDAQAFSLRLTVAGHTRTWLGDSATGAAFVSANGNAEDRSFRSLFSGVLGTDITGLWLGVLLAMSSPMVIGDTLLGPVTAPPTSIMFELRGDVIFQGEVVSVMPLSGGDPQAVDAPGGVMPLLLGLGAILLLRRGPRLGRAAVVSAVTAIGMLAPPAIAAPVMGELTGTITSHNDGDWQGALGLSNGPWAPTPFTLSYYYDVAAADFRNTGAGFDVAAFYGSNADGAIQLSIAFAGRVVAMTSSAASPGGVVSVTASGSDQHVRRIQSSIDVGEAGIFPFGLGLTFEITESGPFIANQNLYSPVSWSDTPMPIVVMLGQGLMLFGTAGGNESATPVPEPVGLPLFAGAVGGLLLLRRRRRGRTNMRSGCRILPISG